MDTEKDKAGTWPLMVLRHGKTEGNAKNRYIGVTDEPLSPEGIQSIDPLPKLPGFIAVSPMQRCMQTAALLIGCDPGMVCSAGKSGSSEEIRRLLLNTAGEEGIPCRIVEDLRECDFGTFENRNYLEMASDPAYLAWVDSGGTLPFPGGESREGFTQRTVRAFLKLLDEFPAMPQEAGQEPFSQPYVLLVVHGGTIMSLLFSLAVCEDGSERDYYGWHAANGHGFWLACRRNEAGEALLQLITEV